MKRTKKKLVALLLAGAMGMALCACDDKSTSVEKTDIDLSKYPIDTDVKLTYWMELHGNISATAANFGETEFAKGLRERTGVEIEYLHPAAGQGKQTFNLLIASGEYPDLMQYNWIDAIAGGPDAAIGNEVIIPLNDLIKEYAPNLSAYLDENPDVKRAVTSDEGNYYVFPSVTGSDSMLNTAGPVLRADWLRDLGLDKPETLEDWEEMLRAFRDKKGATAPLTVGNGRQKMLYGLVGMTSEFFLDGDSVTFGPLTEEFDNGIEILNRWYKEGILDKNYALPDNNTTESNILNGLSGACFASGGQNLGKWLTAKKGTEFDLCGVGVPSINGKPNRFGSVGVSRHSGNSSTAITTSCKYPSLAAKYLDYVYGEEGYMYANFGTEGVSYEMVDGYPKYTDEIMKNPEGLSVSQALAQHMLAGMSGTYVSDPRYLEQYYEMPQQKQALDAWNSQKEHSGKTWLPKLVLTAEEATEYSNIYTDIKKYCDENIIAFIIGEKPLSELDSFKKQIEKMRISRATEIQQAAYDRYMSK